MAITQIKSVFLFSLLFILLFSSSSSSSSSSSRRNDFDGYQLQVQWVPATCSDERLGKRCSKVPQDKFSIHGLWPIRFTPYQVIGPCSGSTFSLNNIRPIEFGLYQNWPDVITRNDEELWRKEWRNHGTCSEQYNNQLQYFTFAVNSFTRHNFTRYLGNVFIRPLPFVNGNSKTRAEEAIRNAIGVTPALQCNFNNLSKTQQLHEIRLCFSKDSKNLRDCSPTMGNCPNTFSWFPYMRTLYSHFQVSLHWQPATCLNSDTTLRCVRNPEIRFSINGVWAVTSNGVRLSSCIGSNFNLSQISLLTDRLNKGWPDLFSNRNDGHWGSEWRNYGRCSEDQFGQLQYFSFGLHVYETYDPLLILRRNNFVPNGQETSSFEMRSALERVTGVRHTFLCNRRMINSTTTRFQLHQIIFCYDSYGRRLQGCIGNQIPAGLIECPIRIFWFP